MFRIKTTSSFIITTLFVYSHTVMRVIFNTAQIHIFIKQNWHAACSSTYTIAVVVSAADATTVAAVELILTIRRHTANRQPHRISKNQIHSSFFSCSHFYFVSLNCWLAVECELKNNEKFYYAQNNQNKIEKKLRTRKDEPEECVNFNCNEIRRCIETSLFN